MGWCHPRDRRLLVDCLRCAHARVRQSLARGDGAQCRTFRRSSLVGPLPGRCWPESVKAWQPRRLYDKQRQTPNLASLSWQAFERLIGEHFRRRGYQVSGKGGAQPDGGIDLVVTRNEERHVVQCKPWKARQVSVSVVRELVGSITQSGASGGFLVTSGSLTDPALKLAHDAGIVVLDGATLRADLGNQDVLGGVDDKGAGNLSPAPTNCPVCGNRMLLRTARRGDRAGERFWGCSGFPSCRGTRPLSL